MKKAPRLILFISIVGIVIVVSIVLGVLDSHDINVKYSEYTTIIIALPQNCGSCLIVSSNELQKSVEEVYNINLGQQDYSKHSLILTFNKKLKSLTEHLGSHPGYYKPTVRKAETLNFATASYEDENYENTIFVDITDRTDIACDDEYGFGTCWD